MMHFSGYTRYKKQIKKDNKTSLNITIGLMILFTTPAWTNISNTVIKIIGIGYEERCYYSDDLNKYNVPDELIDTSNGISKIFVLSDVSNKIYVGKSSEPIFFYSFTYSNLNRIKCFKSSTIERND
ncbi:TPA: hypothetical protein QIS90_001289 [Providencia rettgeri]|nr:hypothetical protein [Providencia rettgeri]